MKAERFLLGCLISLFLMSFAAAQTPCSSLGYINGTEYCDIDGLYHPLKAAGIACDNNYECVNYSCKEGFCQSKYVNVSLDLTETNTLIQEIWEFILGIECNPLNLSYHCEGNEAFLCGVNGVWESKGVIPGECDIPLYTCGDRIVEEGYEQCDDGNLINEDACLNNCVINICGDSVINSGVEQCDDGANGIIGDGCTDTCLIENCLPGEVGTTACIGYYNSTCGSDLVWHPADNMVIGECGVECLPLWNESCNEQELWMCNESYVWSNYGLVNGKCGYHRPSGGGGGGGHGAQGIDIIIYSPLEGITYGNSIIPLLVDDLGDLAEFWKYSLNGAKKISFTPNASIAVASEGYNTLIVYAREEFKTSIEVAKAVNFKVVFPPASQPGYCGDEICRDEETCESCSSDCGVCITEPVLVCGDGICDIAESSYDCIDDCEPGERSIVVAVITVIILILLLGGLGFFLYKKFFEDAFRRWRLLDPRAEKVLRA